MDLKRVGGLAPSTGAVSSRLDIGVGKTETSSKILVPAAATSGTTDEISSPTTASTPTVSAPAVSKPSFGLGIQQRALNFGAAAVGNAIRGMYQNLNQAGFNPGEEFVVAVQEGRKIGADIVLGDRDVEVTLRRLTQALAATDLNKLLNPDSDFERNMKELMPGGNELPPSTGDPDAFKKDMTTFVESIKSRENVRKIMAELKEVAPALVEVMLTERDTYMATGLDTLNQYSVIVAVMGIAHQDGVENNLQQKGWTRGRPKC